MQVPWVGGPVIRCPLLYNSFWGPAWSNASHQALANQINQFTKDLLASNFQNTLTQYGELGGAGAGALVQSSFLANVPSTLTVSSYQQIIQQCINANALPQAVDLNTTVSVPMVMIYLDEHTIINGGGRQLNFPGAPDLAYHDSFGTSNGHPCVYAFMAYLPLGELTWVMSHEFAEAVTDPLYNAWTPDHAGHEIGDYCEGSNATIIVSGRSWTVQTIWSNANNACIAPPAAPIPKQHPGPFGAAAVARGAGGVQWPAVLSVADIAPHDRVLPLPSIDVDHQAGVHSMSQAAVNEYLKRMFHPMHHSELVTDLPQVLRSFAAVLEASLGPAPPSNGPDIVQPVQPPSGGRGPGVARRA
jgi:hypothetical protein